MILWDVLSWRMQYEEVGVDGINLRLVSIQFSLMIYATILLQS